VFFLYRYLKGAPEDLSDFLQLVSCYNCNKFILVLGYRHHYGIFVSQIKYVSGSYDTGEGFEKLNRAISEYEVSKSSGSYRRLFYLALPPSVYPSVCKMIRTYCMNPCKSFFPMLDFFYSYKLMQIFSLVTNKYGGVS
jgi:glucose-6-phosphate 1-dehydrogenase